MSSPSTTQETTIWTNPVDNFKYRFPSTIHAIVLDDNLLDTDKSFNWGLRDVSDMIKYKQIVEYKPSTNSPIENTTSGGKRRNTRSRSYSKRRNTRRNRRSGKNKVYII